MNDAPHTNNLYGSRRSMLRIAFCWLMADTAINALVLLCYLIGSPVASGLDLGGWLFFITSCISHGACFALIPFLFYSLLGAAAGLRRTAAVAAITLSMIIAWLLLINMQVYRIFRFHINGFVINLLTSGAAGEIFIFDSWLIAKVVAGLLVVAAAIALLWVWVSRLGSKLTAFGLWSGIGAIVGATLFAHLYHIYASFHQQPSVLRSERLIPWYYPTTANSLMLKLGYVTPRNADNAIPSQAEGEIRYPLAPIVSHPADDKPNILLVVLDSWNPRTLESETMPFTKAYADSATLYTNHFSSSNGTRGSVFGIFYSLPAYYWAMFEASRANPVFIHELLRQGYNVQVYPGAPISSPPFHRVVFREVPDLNLESEGITAWDRDRRLTDNFISDLRRRSEAGSKQPFFAMLFYDLPHSFEMSEDKLHFSPTWKYPDYTALNAKLDPLPFYNLYRSTVFEADAMIAEAIGALKQYGVDDNTVVIITGDHGQEFNESGKNFWVHGSNFSRYQLNVPMITRFPGDSCSIVRSHRTSHYDIVPTLMQRVLNVANPPSDYSAGRPLPDTTDRGWQVVGSNINYGFIIEGDTILEQTYNGALEVYDPQLNPVDGYRINPAAFRRAMDRLNAFMR